jgi:hypothetical protein
MIYSLENLSTFAPAALATTAHGSRSPKYQVVTTADIVTTLASDGWQIDSAMQLRCRDESRNAHAKHNLRLSHPDIPSRGEYRPQVVIQNASDGSSAVRLFAGMFRFACANGIVVGDAVSRLVLPHRGANLMKNIIEHAAQIRGRMNKVAEVVEQWRSIELDTEAQHRFAANACRLRWEGATIVNRAQDSIGDLCKGEKLIDTSSFLQVRRKADSRNDLWTTFNRVQETLIRGGTEVYSLDPQDLTPRLIRSRRVTSMDTDNRINQGLWNLASQTADLLSN